MTTGMQIDAAKRMLAAKRAQDSLIDFTKFTMPDAKSDDPLGTTYKDALHHRAIAHACETTIFGKDGRLILTMPPRHGKSELASRRLPPFYSGHFPTGEVIFSTYSGDFAEDFGRKSREIIRSPEYSQVFPETKLKTDSQAATRLETTQGGILFFVGVGGALTGRGADVLLIDDPFKNREEAESETIRDSRWEWFTSTAYTRLMPGGRIIIIMTRWHEDDIVGRIMNPDYVDPEEAAQWNIINLPAIAEEDDPLKRKPGEALWPERYPASALERTRAVLSTTDWSALYQQKPSPDEGTYFLKEDLMTYTRGQLPARLKMYGASDHALTKKQKRDASVLGCVGVDDDGIIYVLPDIYWDRCETDTMVQEMINLMLRHKPSFWWAEDEHIKKSIAPFLRKEQRRQHAYTPVVGLTSSVDLQQRARPVQGMVSLGMVRFPKHAPWWARAQKEMLDFPNGTHDDFVSFMSLIGRGLEYLASPKMPKKKLERPEVGTLAWVKWAHNEELKQQRRMSAGGF